MKKKITARFMVWTIVVTLIVLIPWAMQFTNEVQWNEAFAYSFIVLAGGGIYELVMLLKMRSWRYRLAFCLGLAGVLLIGWVNGAIGFIGSENNPANRLYWAVFITWLVGSLISAFKPRGMSQTLFATAAVHLLVPVFALFIWPARTSWGAAGVSGVFIFNAFFAAFFIISAILFRKESFSESNDDYSS